MNKLQELAWKRNGAMGRISFVLSGLKSLLDLPEFLDQEKKDIQKAIGNLNNILRQKEKSWEALKKRKGLKRKGE